MFLTKEQITVNISIYFITYTQQKWHIWSIQQFNVNRPKQNVFLCYEFTFNSMQKKVIIYIVSQVILYNYGLLAKNGVYHFYTFPKCTALTNKKFTILGFIVN